MKKKEFYKRSEIKPAERDSGRRVHGRQKERENARKSMTERDKERRRTAKEKTTEK